MQSCLREPQLIDAPCHSTYQPDVEKRVSHDASALAASGTGVTL